MQLNGIEEAKEGIKCSYQSQYWKGGELEITVSPLEKPSSSMVFKIDSKSLRHWIFTMDQTKLLLVVVFKDYTQLKSIEQTTEKGITIQLLDQSEVEITTCDYSAIFLKRILLNRFNVSR